MHRIKDDSCKRSKIQCGGLLLHFNKLFHFLLAATIPASLFSKGHHHHPPQQQYYYHHLLLLFYLLLTTTFVVHQSQATTLSTPPPTLHHKQPQPPSSSSSSASSSQKKQKVTDNMSSQVGLRGSSMMATAAGRGSHLYDLIVIGGGR